MATWGEVEKIVANLPEQDESTSYGHRAWKVRGKTFVWERPLGKSDQAAVRALGEEPYGGDILAVRVADEGAKQAVLGDTSLPCFTIPHFDGYPAVLVRLAEATHDQLVELITEAWLDRAPATLREQWPDHP